jgi:BirA family biotin operon repressor/biotin-[acetyl-CoA-carboxylase] ligase
LKIEHFDTLPSTQKYLIEKIRSGDIEETLISTDIQTDGVGSRGNSWIGERGNLLFSFSINKNRVPKDTPLQSLSIYFSLYLFQILKRFNSEIILKWPNDFYLKDKKLGGTVTNIVKNFIIVGIGINRVSKSGFGSFDFPKSNREILELLISDLKELKSWREIFSIYKDEFENSRRFSINHKERRVPLKDSTLNSDGSILIGDEVIYSER